jgi:hypothetical protein
VQEIRAATPPRCPPGATASDPGASATAPGATARRDTCSAPGTLP